MIVPILVGVFWLVSVLAQAAKKGRPSGETSQTDDEQDELRRQRRRKLQEMAGEHPPRTFKELVATIKKQIGEAASEAGKTLVPVPEQPQPQTQTKPGQKTRAKTKVTRPQQAAASPARMRPVAGPPGHAGEDAVHRHVPDTAMVQPLSSRPRVLPASFSRSQLRQAWMMREVFGPPVALLDDTRGAW